MTEKNLYVRCDQETYDMAHAIAKKESRSLNKQLIYMIHEYAKEMRSYQEQYEKEQADALGHSENKELYESGKTPLEDYLAEEDQFAGNQGRSIEMGLTTEEFENLDYDEPTESGLQKLSEIKKSDSAD
tara:strand:- start:281 stop:667 length:387 start_codon:yes stop_codon:yes gene_type:complete